MHEGEALAIIDSFQKLEANLVMLEKRTDLIFKTQNKLADAIVGIAKDGKLRGELLTALIENLKLKNII